MPNFDRTFLSPTINIEREGDQIVLSLTTDYDADTEMTATLAFSPMQAFDTIKRMMTILEGWDATDVQRSNSQVRQ